MKKNNLFLVVLVLLSSLTSCLKDESTKTVYSFSEAEGAILSQKLNLSRELVDYKTDFPEHMTRNNLTPSNVNNGEALLGRVLFYDTNLSKSKNISCASCHQQSFAFSDVVAKSIGHDGGETNRNSLALASVVSFPVYYGGNMIGGTFIRPQFMWDERFTNIMDQSHAAITDAVEMGMEFDELTTRLEGEDYYSVLFNNAYNSTEITETKILQALQTFVNAMVTVNSKYDEGMNRHTNLLTDFSNFTSKENRGKELFMNHCASCHGQDQTLPVERTANNGLALAYDDNGLGELTGAQSDMGKFKVPPLRNIAVTGPYMHDGRFETLIDVVNFYNNGVVDHENLDHRLQVAGQVKRLNLSAADKQALVSFMETLTDYELLDDERFADPFLQ